jgi:hypothetical protein
MPPVTPLHHLPRPAQNLPYLMELAVDQPGDQQQQL